MSSGDGAWRVRPRRRPAVVLGHRPNHLLHFFIGLFTVGLWWIVWLVIAMFGGEKRQTITIEKPAGGKGSMCWCRANWLDSPTDVREG